MRPPASYAFSLAVGRGESARGRRPSLRRSSWPGRALIKADAGRMGRNLLSRPAAVRTEPPPSLGPSGEPIVPTGDVARKADPVSFLTLSQGASVLKADIGEDERTRATDSSPECNAPAPAGA